MTPADQLPLWDLVEWRVSQTPDAVMAVDERDREITFGEYRERCLRVAAHFAARGVACETPVAWMLPTWIESLVLAGALARLGAVQVPLLPILRDREVGFILRATGAGHLVVPGSWRDYDYPALAARVAADLPAVAVTVCDRSLADADPSDLVPWERVRPADGDDPVRWIFFTSGTTADPKGCLHTDRTVAASGHRLNLRFRMQPDDRNALVFPVTHIGGISFLMAGLLVGHRHILVEAFQPESSCEVLSRHGVTIAGSGPAFWMAYVAAQRRSPDRRMFPALRALVGGGAAKPPTLQDEVREVLGVPLVSGYGSSECPGVAHCGVDDPPDVLRSDGYALDDSAIEVVGADGRTLPPGEAGEIVVRGPMLFRGYLDPAHDARAFDARGWLRTGDVGTIDARGVLHVTGRLKDIIIRKGENISAKEIEDVLYQHPAIADVAAIALPDAARGELCCAVVVVDAGQPAPSLDDIAAHCAAHDLAKQKFPERLEIVDALPRNATGKVLKHELVARFG